MVVLLTDVGDKTINRWCHSNRINIFLGCKGTNKRAKKQVLTGKACLPSQECLFTVSASTFMAYIKVRISEQKLLHQYFSVPYDIDTLLQRLVNHYLTSVNGVGFSVARVEAGETYA